MVAVVKLHIIRLLGSAELVLRRPLKAGRYQRIRNHPTVLNPFWSQLICASETNAKSQSRRAFSLSTISRTFDHSLEHHNLRLCGTGCRNQLWGWELLSVSLLASAHATTPLASRASDYMVPALLPHVQQISCILNSLHYF